MLKSEDNLEGSHFYLYHYKISKWSLNSASQQCVHLKHTTHMCFRDTVGNVGGIIIFIWLFRFSELHAWNASSSQRACSVPHYFGRSMFDMPRTPMGVRAKLRGVHTPIACRVWKQSTEHTISCLCKCIQQKKLINLVVTTLKNRFCASF